MKAAAEIYALCCPESGEIRYIGKANDSRKRFASHLRDARRRRTPVYDWIRSLVQRGQLPDVRVIMSAFDWEKCERQVIAQHRADGVRLLNLADGGDQPSCTREQRQANAARVNEKRERDPFAYAVHSLLRSGGLMARDMEKAGNAELAQRLRKHMDRIRAMDRDWVGYQMSFRPRYWRHFPAWLRPHLPDLQGAA